MLGLVRLRDLNEFQPADGGIVEGQCLCLTLLDLNGLRRTVQHEPVHCGGFFRGNNRARLQIREYNAAIFVRFVDALVGPT